MERLIPESEAAEMLGIAAATLRNWRSQRRGPAWVRVGRRRLYDVRDLEQYLVAGRVDPGERP
jgi:DNA-binding transcriptional MerR regulator